MIEISEKQPKLRKQSQMANNAIHVSLPQQTSLSYPFEGNNNRTEALWDECSSISLVDDNEKRHRRAKLKSTLSAIKRIPFPM
jgi:hypothetical protein